MVRPQAHTLFCWGLPRRLRREQWGLPPYGALTLFFRWRKKSVQKKASGTATLAARPAMRRGLRSAVAPSGLSSTLVRFAHPSGKKPFTAHFAGGARYVARSMIGQISPAIRRAPNSPFSAVKMGGPFSLRCLSPLCSPAVGVVHTYPLRVGRFVMTWIFLHRKRPAWFQIHAGLFKRAMRPVAEWR